MVQFFTSRLLQSVTILTIMSFVIFVLMGWMPGDPIDLMIASNPKMTPAGAAHLRDLYGVDKPIIERYLNWLLSALRGDFGYSRLHSRPVLDVMFPALQNTLVLLGCSFVLALSIGLPLGIFAASRPYSKFDYCINLLAFAGISIPPFWLALLLIIVFAVLLGVLPAGGLGVHSGAGGIWENLRFLILPVASLTIASVGSHTRYMRSAMIETLRQDYIRTARAKGLSHRQVLLLHALRNAMIPVATVVALDFGSLFSGALITETIFAYPGMGKLIFDAVMGNDFNLALVSLLFATVMTLSGNFLADISYVWLDPRLSYHRSDQK